MTPYAELQVTSNYSFLHGASHPEELVSTAAALRLSGIAVTDRNSLAGVVRAHASAKQLGFPLVVGARLDFIDDTPPLLCLPTDRDAYGRLSHLLSTGNLRAPKGRCHLTLDDLAAHADGQILILLAPSATLRDLAPDRTYLALSDSLDGGRRDHIIHQSQALGLPLLVTNDVHYHLRGRRPLQDVLTATRHHTTVEQAAGSLLFANAERCLKSGDAMARLFPAHGDAIARSVEIASRCRFTLDSLGHDYPAADTPDGWTSQDWLAHLSFEGAKTRYPGGVPAKVTAQLEHELAIVGQMAYADYFLTVHDIVRFAVERGILCQGRGSAANSAVCYCLGITALDPACSDLLFERFISVERGEPPDIDVDFEHERREEVMQYLYQRYGRDRAALTAAVITWRSRSALRDVGKALGLSEDSVARLSRTVWGSSREATKDQRVREAGLDPGDARLQLILGLTEEIKGFPRHLSQHVGGFVLTRTPLDRIVPIANAAMEGRTTIEWDKDDLDALGILKVDILALGMLSCIRKCFDLIARHHGKRFDLATIPREDPGVYDMLCRGDSVGVFQVESRAQMTMLPRLKPRCFYDLVIEVAIVRPGPIQGDMVHPYLRRRSGAEPVTYPSEALRAILAKTLGVPLFQEQAMRIAIEGAGFTPAEADQLRRAMAAFRRTGTVSAFRDKFLTGMAARGYAPEFAAACFRQIEGFGDYGFPESHAASFALLVYASAWMKCRYPAAFACALLNCQPMGFYAPAQIIRDTQDHGVRVLPVDVNASDWDCTLEDGKLRLGLRQITGLGEAEAKRLVASRGTRYASPKDLWRRARLSGSALKALAGADAFVGMGLARRDALWAVKGLNHQPLPLFDGAGPEDAALLPRETPAEDMAWDYHALKLSLKRHPLALMRTDLAKDGYRPARALTTMKSGLPVKVAGLVITRQRPGTAKGLVFMTVEDEEAVANLIIRADILEAFRPIVLSKHLIGAEGQLQKEGLVIHVVVKRLWDLAPLFTRHLPAHPGLSLRSRDFC